MHELDRQSRDDSTSTITLAAAGLVGILYGVAAAAILISQAAAIAVVATYQMIARTTANVARDISNPIKAVSHVALGAIGVGAVVTTLIAMTAIIAPIMIVTGPLSSREHARQNPRAGLLEQVFGSYRKLLAAASRTKEQFAKLTNQSSKLER